jgi:hypothetical protein
MLRVVDLRGSDVRTLSGLEHVEDVYLAGSSRLEDISPLAGARRVWLEACSGVRDVAPLASVAEVALVRMNGLHDLAALSHGSVRRLCCRDMELFTSQPFHTLAHLTLENVNLRRGSLLLPADGRRALQSLRLRLVHYRHDAFEALLKGAEDVAHVAIDACDTITSAWPFHTARKLSLSNCRSLVDVSALGGLREVCLARCVHLEDVSGVAVAAQPVLPLTQPRNSRASRPSPPAGQRPGPGLQAGFEPHGRPRRLGPWPRV